MSEQVKVKSQKKTFISLSKRIRVESIFFLIIYIAVLFWQTFIYAYGSYQRSSQDLIEFNLIPFKTIWHYVTSFNQLNLNVWFFNLFGNVIAFVPFGFLLPCTSKKLNYLWKIIVITLLFSLFIEVMQIVFRVGVFDIDDMILNTVGGLIGYLIKHYIEKTSFRRAL